MPPWEASGGGGLAAIFLQIRWPRAVYVLHYWQLVSEAIMSLIKCPSCKNAVSNESYCCPRCGKSFTVMRVRRLLFWLIVLIVAAWAVFRYGFNGQLTWKWLPAWLSR